jgi:cytochrome P450
MIGANWLRWIPYLVLGRLFNRPPLLVALARAFERMGAPIACRIDDLVTVYRRTDDFSNRAHYDNLIAGDFVIGMDGGPHQMKERAAVHNRLPAMAAFGALAGTEACARIEKIKATLERGGSFDLVNDYLTFVAWSGLRGVFDGPSSDSIEGVSATAAPAARDAALTVLFQELRHVGGHLVVGGVAPRSVQVRAKTSAEALNHRVARSLAEIRANWQSGCPYAAQTAQRQAVGLMWVGHPAMVQAGALIFQELQAHADEYAALHKSVNPRAKTLGSAAYADEKLRTEVRGHVLECLRLRPPFPFLSRLLPREADLQLGAKARIRTVAAGHSVYLAIAAALRGRSGYDPEQALIEWKHPDKLPIFGAGPRACVAREQVVELLVSALIGMLSLPLLGFADAGRKRIVYDGPILTRVRLSTANSAVTP